MGLLSESGGYMRAVITIREIDKQEPGYIHFKTNDGKSWNCNKQEFVGEFAEGERFYIDYAEANPKPGHQYGAKYINKARYWKHEDGPNTWPDKEPYTGGAPSTNSGSTVNTSFGGAVKKNDYDPEIGKRQTSANCGMMWCKDNCKTVDELAVMFPVVADIVFKYVDDKGGLATVVDIAGKNNAGGDDSEEFGF